MSKKCNIRIGRILTGWENDLYERREALSWNEFQTFFRNIYKVTNNNKLRSFQYRLLNRAIVVNAHLYRWGILDTNLCTFCNLEKETVMHIMYECTYVKRHLASSAGYS